MILVLWLENKFGIAGFKFVSDLFFTKFFIMSLWYRKYISRYINNYLGVVFGVHGVMISRSIWDNHHLFTLFPYKSESITVLFY